MILMAWKEGNTKGGGQGEQNPGVCPFQFSQKSMSYLRSLKSSIPVTQLLQEVRATPTANSVESRVSQREQLTVSAS